MCILAAKEKADKIEKDNQNEFITKKVKPWDLDSIEYDDTNGPDSLDKPKKDQETKEEE